jgi:hypothetical protein
MQQSIIWLPQSIGRPQPMTILQLSDPTSDKQPQHMTKDEGWQDVVFKHGRNIPIHLSGFMRQD